MVDPERLELPTPAFEAQCSIQLSYGSRLADWLAHNIVVQGADLAYQTTKRVGTAAPGCPAERSSATPFRKGLSSCARLDSWGSCPHVVCGG